MFPRLAPFLVVIVLSVLRWFTPSDYLFSCGHCIVGPSLIYALWLPLFLWSLYCLFFVDLRPLITSLVSCGHCIVGPSLIYALWLPLFLWPFYFQSFVDLRPLITSLVSSYCSYRFFYSIYNHTFSRVYIIRVIL